MRIVAPELLLSRIPLHTWELGAPHLPTGAGVIVVVVAAMPRIGTGNCRSKGLRGHQAVEHDRAEMMGHWKESPNPGNLRGRAAMCKLKPHASWPDATANWPTTSGDIS